MRASPGRSNHQGDRRAVAVDGRKFMHRRDVLKLGAMAGLSVTFGAAAARPARAEDWPSKNVRVIVPYAAGSATDLIPRTIFDALGAKVGHTFIVENRLGGGTTLGASAVARAEPDGYTVLVHSNAIVTVPATVAVANVEGSLICSLTPSRVHGPMLQGV